MMRLAIFVGALVLLTIAIGVGDYRQMQRHPLDVSAPSLIEVPQGQSLIQLLNGWQSRGWLRAPRDVYWARLAARLDGRDRGLQAGEYQLRPGQSLDQALAMIMTGRIHQRLFTVLAGERFDQLLGRLQQAPGLSIASDKLSGDAIMRRLGKANIHPEGQFLPETYAYRKGATDISLLQRASDALDAALAEAWSGRAEDLPLDSPAQALILASIIEKETGLASERPEIAGVFVRRLRRGMRLQTDPTVIYGLGNRFDGNLRRRDLRADTPYNTYTRHGLPPTPIAMASHAAIIAATQPAGGDTLYFVARGDGSHQFSRTLQEHQDAVRRYQLR